MRWKSACYIGSTTISLDQPRLKSLNPGAVYIPKMDSKDGRHPKLPHTLGVFPLIPLELQTIVNLRYFLKNTNFQPTCTFAQLIAKDISTRVTKVSNQIWHRNRFCESGSLVQTARILSFNLDQTNHCWINHRRRPHLHHKSLKNPGTHVTIWSFVKWGLPPGLAPPPDFSWNHPTQDALVEKPCWGPCSSSPAGCVLPSAGHSHVAPGICSGNAKKLKRIFLKSIHHLSLISHEENMSKKKKQGHGELKNFLEHKK